MYEDYYAAAEWVLPEASRRPHPTQVSDTSRAGRGSPDVVRGAWRYSLELTGILVHLTNGYPTYWNRMDEFNPMGCGAIGSRDRQIPFKWVVSRRMFLGASRRNSLGYTKNPSCADGRVSTYWDRRNGLTR